MWLEMLNYWSKSQKTNINNTALAISTAILHHAAAPGYATVTVDLEHISADHRGPHI